MSKVLLYYAHPGHRFSQVNRAMWRAARSVEGITRVDLYAEYPRFNIDVDREQARLRNHDIILFQHPLFWYATPALIKEWQDLVLEHGFAYGKGGTAMEGKALGQAVTAAGPEEAYSETGFQNHPLRTFLTPMEQTARLCGMRYLAPYVLHGALRAPASGEVAPHAEGFVVYLKALRDDRLDLDQAEQLEKLTAVNLPLRKDN